MYQKLFISKTTSEIQLKISVTRQVLRKFARKFSNIDFSFLKIFPLKDDELMMSEM